MERNKEYLKKLLETPSPSGMEGPAVDVFDSEMSKGKDNLQLFRDKMNNSAWFISEISENSRPSLLLSGHIDSICGLITRISKETGLISVMSGGGWDKKVLQGTRVSILGDKVIPGVVEKKPLHLERHDDPSEIKWENIKINTGYTHDQLEELGVHVGSRVIYERGNSDLEFGKDGSYIVSPDLDDKIAVYIITEVAKQISPSKEKMIAVAAISQEETGLRGAGVCASRINPDISIDLDVTFAENDDTCSEVKLGSGPVIDFGPDKNVDLSNDLIRVAKENGIPYQLEASRAGGTNTHAIQVRSKDVVTAHIGIPLKNMHTPVEMVSWSDVDNCISLLVQYLKST